MKRFLCALAVAAVLMLCVACGSRVVSSGSGVATAAPTSSSSRNIRNEPVTVDETIADADTVNNAQTAAPAAASATPTATAEAAGSEAETDTPATGDIPVAYLAAVIGLILICSAGLVMLRRI